MVKQELIIKRHDYGELKYFPAISGKIELLKLTESLSILKLYFQKLKVFDKPKEMYFDDAIEVMLSNFPIKVSSIDDLDKKEIFIDEGFEGEALTTMLSIYDGEPINKSRILFKKIKEHCFEIEWTGCWGEDNYDNQNFKLNIFAFKEENVTTPICEWEKDLIEKFDK
ncbi:hypothetical protein K8089_15515 [Aequorivita sp. F47161]|uniref:Uncharacterized protein n=1 Tax=Aequorivita vitellina TaxID=2874475 RepID=A0A9X1R1H4_9FLAO|nr:hypothetical protein [Aequorivita vitellina]MCG2420434.1 hypothetical protein [Aequorivita vitellina]